VFLNDRLAALDFTGEKAENMPQEEFERDILPEAQNITHGLLDDPITIY